MKSVHMVTFTLLVVGGLNWALTSLGYNLVNMVLGGMPGLENLVYLLIGAAAVYEVVNHMAMCKLCGKK